MMRLVLALCAALATAACGLPKIGGEAPPPRLTTLAATAPEPGPGERANPRSQAVSFATPLLPQALATTRVAAIEGGTAVAYITDLLLVDTPDALFQSLLGETAYRTTDLLVIDPAQITNAPSLRVTGRLYRFDYDVNRREVVVGYEAMWTRDDYVATRRFEAREPADGYADTVAPALNVAANRVAVEVAEWLAAS